MILTNVPGIDREVGMLTYANPELYVGNYLSYVQSPNTFVVREVGLNGLVANTELCLSKEILKEVINELVRNYRYSLLIMCKEGLPTLDAVSLVSKYLRVRRLGFAGLKDANAHTCQFLSVESKYLPVLTELVKDSVIEVRTSSGRVWLCITGLGTNHWLGRGDLEGNSFTIKMVIKDPERISEVEGILRRLGNSLLPNYFGYQRFGSRRPITHLVGRELLMGNYEGAIEVLVGKPSEYESESVRRARELFRLGKLREALNAFPSKFWIERKVISDLIRGKSPRDVIKSLGTKYLRLFIEAYQSYLFNLALSKLIIDLGSTYEVARRCDVLELPNLGIRYLSNQCDYVVKEVVNEYLRGLAKDFVKYLRSGVRSTVFTVRDLVISREGNYVVIGFTLGPSTYASVVLRELLREDVVKAL